MKIALPLRLIRCKPSSNTVTIMPLIITPRAGSPDAVVLIDTVSVVLIDTVSVVLIDTVSVVLIDTVSVVLIDTGLSDRSSDCTPLYVTRSM